MKNPAAQTAYGPIAIAASEQGYPEKERIVEDRLALQFLPDGLRLIGRVIQWQPARNLLFSISEKRAAGVWDGVLCRKRYIDDQLTKALDEGVENVVIMGAGLDTHACRLPEKAKPVVYELDLPENIDYKRKALQKIYGNVPSHVKLVAIDFNTERLDDALGSQGYSLQSRTFFIWEAVTQYLTSEGVQTTFEYLSRAASGSQLVFTYIHKDFIDGVNTFKLDTLYKVYRVDTEIWKFGMHPDEVSSYLESFGWQVVEQMDSRAFQERYMKPGGRKLAVTDIERSVCSIM